MLGGLHRGFGRGGRQSNTVTRLSLAFREPRPDRAYPSVFHVLAAVGSTLKPCAGRAQRFWRRLARHIIVLQGSHPRHQSMLFAASHAQPDSETACGHRQTDRQRNARPKPRTTKGVVWRTDTQLPVPKRRPHTHPSRRKPMPQTNPPTVLSLT